MDEIRGSVSRLKKKIKHRLAGSKRESRGMGSGVDTENVDSAGPPPQAEPRVVTGGRHDLEGNNDDEQSVKRVLFSQPITPTPSSGNPESM